MLGDGSAQQVQAQVQAIAADEAGSGTVPTCAIEHAGKHASTHTGPHPYTELEGVHAHAAAQDGAPQPGSSPPVGRFHRLEENIHENLQDGPLMMHAQRPQQDQAGHGQLQYGVDGGPPQKRHRRHSAEAAVREHLPMVSPSAWAGAGPHPTLTTSACNQLEPSAQIARAAQMRGLPALPCNAGKHVALKRGGDGLTPFQDRNG